MIVRKTDEVAAADVKDAGAKGAKIRVLVGEPEGAPNFILRHFRLEPGGFSPRHSHAWEHEVYVLDGAGVVFGGGKEEILAPGKAVFVPPNEEHQFRAASDKPLVFLCIIPKM